MLGQSRVVIIARGPGGRPIVLWAAETETDKRQIATT